MSPAQHPTPHACPAVEHAVTATQTPPVHDAPPQHSPSYAQRVPSPRQAHRPAEQLVVPVAQVTVHTLDAQI